MVLRAESHRNVIWWPVKLFIEVFYVKGTMSVVNAGVLRIGRNGTRIEGAEAVPPTAPKVNEYLPLAMLYMFP